MLAFGCLIPEPVGPISVYWILCAFSWARIKHFKDSLSDLEKLKNDFSRGLLVS